MDRPSLTNCSPQEVCSALGRLGKFQCVGGGKHNIKIQHPDLETPFPLPNRIPLNRHVVKGIIDDILIGLLHIPEKDIYKELWC